MAAESPFQPAQLAHKTLKVMVFGASGAGKTRFSLTFPKPAVIDLEHGTDWYGDQFAFQVLHTKSTDEVKQAINWLVEQGNGDFETVVIDPITILYEQFQAKYQEIAERRAERQGKSAESASLTWRDWGLLKREWTTTLNSVVNAGLHLVGVAREKDVYRGTGDNRELIGVGPSSEKGSEAYFDQVIRLVNEPTGRVALVLKDRPGVLGQRFEQPTFDAFMAAIEKADRAPMQYQEIDAHAAATQDASKAVGEPAPVKEHNGKWLPCPECGGKMLERSGSKGKFYGCSKYPDCRQTMNPDVYEKAVAEMEAARIAKPSEPEPEKADYEKSINVFRKVLKENMDALNLTEEHVAIACEEVAPGADLQNLPWQKRSALFKRMEILAGMSPPEDEGDPFADQ